MSGITIIDQEAFQNTAMLPCEFPDVTFFGIRAFDGTPCYPLSYPKVVTWYDTFSQPFPDFTLRVPATCALCHQATFGAGPHKLICEPRNGKDLTFGSNQFRGKIFDLLVLAEGITQFTYYMISHPNCTVVMPSTITYIDKYWFGYTSYCPNFKLYMKMVTPPSIISGLPVLQDGIVRIPIGSLEAYESASVWSNWAGKYVEYDFEADPDNINQYCV